MAPQTRDAGPADEAWKRAALEVAWGSTTVARLGELIDAAGLPAVIAEDAGRPTGLATYRHDGQGMEVVTIQTSEDGHGAGQALMDHLLSIAREAKVERLWLTTTNDNTRALGFFQRWGMNLCRMIPEGVAASRARKPSIPEVGSSGIPMRHELELELLIEN